MVILSINQIANETVEKKKRKEKNTSVQTKTVKLLLGRRLFQKNYKKLQTGNDQAWINRSRIKKHKNENERYQTL